MAKSFRFKNLDSIRTVAFFSTFLAHSFSTPSATVRASPWYGGAVFLQDVYTFGVPVFFVLSGFLISYLMLREQEKVGRLGVGSFYMRRALRIWPLYFLIIGFGFIVFPWASRVLGGSTVPENASWLHYVLFLSNFDQIAKDQLPYGVGLGPTWSISVEEQFYLVWPLLLVAFPRRRFLIPILAVLVASMFLSPLLDLPAVHTVFAMIYLSVGALFGYAAFYHEPSVRRLTDVPDWVPATVVGLMVLGMYLSGKLARYGLIPLIALAIGYLIVSQCYTKRFDLKSVPLLERGGRFTYGLYLYHSICIFVVHAVFRDLLQVPDTVLLVVVVKPILALVLSVIVSVVSYEYFEAVFLRLKTARFTPLKGSATATSAG